MPVSDKRQGSYALFTSAYFYVGIDIPDLDDPNFELYYWIETDLAPPIISMGFILENKTVFTSFVDSSSTVSGWRFTSSQFWTGFRPNFIELPLATGVYQLFVKGQRSSIGSSGLFVDDIYIGESTLASKLLQHSCI